MTSRREQAKRCYTAMEKFSTGQPLTDDEWHDLSWLSLIDRSLLEFGAINTRWALSDKERADNYSFYRGLGANKQINLDL
jgi:hypothetical protein